MEELLERARTYLDSLEADRQAALSLSEQKAEEAKLIKARQEGFREALEIFGEHVSTANIDPPAHSKELGQRRARRRIRRNIRDLIARELSFSSQPMTAPQIAKAIEYTLKLTETALKRMEKGGQVVRDEEDRWAIGMNGHVSAAGNGKSAPVPKPAYGN
jgi:hypothetical protein